MNRSVLCTAAAVLLLSATRLVSAGLDADIQKVLDEKAMKGKDVGIQVVRLGSSPGELKTIYSKDATTPRRPASNMKLVTTAAALDRLGTDFRFRTKLLLRGQDLILLGDGDPSLGDDELLGAGSDWTSTTVFKAWADDLKKRGVTSVNNLLVDDSVFDTTFSHPNWSPSQYMQPHQAEVSGVSLHANVVNVTVRAKSGQSTVSLDPPSRAVSVQNSCKVGNENRVAVTRDKDDSTLLVRGEVKSGSGGTYQCTVHDPALFAAGSLADVLASAGIPIKGKISRDRGAGRTASGSSVVGLYETPILRVVTQANTRSQNLYAESLCKRMGFAATGSPGSWQSGTACSGEFLRKLGSPSTEFKLDDGCGLSRNNAVSPATLCRVLEHQFYSPTRDAFMHSLATGGSEGTLQHRFQTKDLKDKVFAKTGFIEGVSALSGYVKAKDNAWYAFSILINGIGPKSNSLYKDFEDRIVKSIAD